MTIVFIGIMMFRSQGTQIEQSTLNQINPTTPYLKIFRQAFMVAAGNPKAIIFFSALFPQFINPQSTQGIQFFILLSTMAVIAFICFMVYAMGGEKLVVLFNRKRIRKLINRMIGGTFVGAGIGLAVSD